MAAKSTKNIPIFNRAGDLLVTAAIEFARGNREDALILAAGAFSDASMETLAIALHMSNNAAQEGVPIDQILAEPTDGGDREGDGNGPGDNGEDEVEDLPVDYNPNAITEPDKDIQQEVSRVLRKLIRRENALSEHDSPFVGPGGDTGENDTDDSARNLNEDEPEEEEEQPTDEGDLAEGEDTEGLTDEPDPADPKALAEHPAEASELSEDEMVTIEDEPTDNIPSNLGNKLRNLGEEVDIPVEARATINRISYSGNKSDRDLAAELAKTYLVKRA
jgi:hypothetical protein